MRELTARVTDAAGSRAAAVSMMLLLALLGGCGLLLVPCGGAASTGDGQPEDWQPSDTERAPGFEAEHGAAAKRDDGKTGLVLHQMLSGQDGVAVSRPGLADDTAQLFSGAKQMKNFQYFVGDWDTSEVAVFDGAWDPAGLEAEASRLGLKIVAYIATHYHWDHIGDVQKGIPGMAYFVDAKETTAYIHAVEREDAITKTGIKLHPEKLVGVEVSAVSHGGTPLSLLRS